MPSIEFVWEASECEGTVNIRLVFCHYEKKCLHKYCLFDRAEVLDDDYSLYTAENDMFQGLSLTSEVVVKKS